MQHMITKTNDVPTYVALTRRVQGAYASGDAYRLGRRAALVLSEVATGESSGDNAAVLPFRPR